jgi:hypothetical protein
MACKKKGCLDIYADNYDSSAHKEDNLSCQYTKSYIPDDNFENYLEMHNMGDGIPNNDSVLTKKIIEVDSLNIMYEEISNISGIEQFVNLRLLSIDNSGGNQIASIDLSNNILLETFFCNGNPLNSIDLSNNTVLKNITISNTNISSIDLSNNILLESIACVGTPINSIDLSNNPLLNWFSCGFSQILELDLSNNSSIEFLACSDSPLEKLDLRNGSNNTIINIVANNNPNLSCISVDDVSWCSSNWLGWNYQFDSQVSFSNNCP